MSPDQAAIDLAVSRAGNFVATLNDVILFPLIGLLSGIAFLVFLWGCAQYIMNAANPSAREEGVKHITYGIIGLLVMMSAWAILSIAAATFGLNDNLQRAKDGSTGGTGALPGSGTGGTAPLPGSGTGGTSPLPGSGTGGTGPLP